MENKTLNEVRPPIQQTDAEIVAAALGFIPIITSKLDVLSLRGNEEANRALERLHDVRVYLENLANRLNTPAT